MTSNPVPDDALYRPRAAFDLLRVPGLGRLLRWRWGRLALQLPMLALALVVVYDGLTGSPLASQNIIAPADSDLPTASVSAYRPTAHGRPAALPAAAPLRHAKRAPLRLPVQKPAWPLATPPPASIRP